MVNEAGFKKWLSAQGYSGKTIAAQAAHLVTLRKGFGDLDDLYDGDTMSGLLGTLAYSAADAAEAKPCPPQLKLTSNIYRGLAHLRAAANYYRRFRSEALGIYLKVIPPDAAAAERAMDECDAIGLDEFMASYGFSRRNQRYWVVRGDNRFPSKAVFAVAYQYMPDGIARDVRNSNGTEAREHLSKLGFQIVEDQPKARLEATALLRYRALFLERYPNFVDFQQTSGGYVEDERRYKDKLLALAQQATVTLTDEQQLGGRLLDILTGIGGAPSGLLGWRLDGRVKELRAAYPGVFEREAGRLVKTTDLTAAIATFVINTWDSLAKGQSSKPYSLTRNLPTMLAALAHPDRAYGINTEPVTAAMRALTGATAFGWAPMVASKYADVLELAEDVRDIMATEWAWKPRDLWDVQGFIWATNHALQPHADNEQNIEEIAEMPPTGPLNLILYGPPGTGATCQHGFSDELDRRKSVAR